MQDKPIVLFDIDYTLFDTASFKESGHTKHKIYLEVISTLEKLNKVAELGIFSKGEYVFQVTKLEKTGLSKFFKMANIHVFNDKDINLINVIDFYKDKTLFLVDDKLSILAQAKKHLPSIFTIWIKRGPYAEELQEIEGFTPDRIFVNLREIVSVVDKDIKIEI